MSSEQEIVAFANYEVYEMLGDKKHVLAICEEQGVAELIARLLATRDPKCDPYHIGIIAGPNDFVPGGGCSVTYQMTRREIS